MFPELTGGLHLDRYARVLAVHDAPELGDSSERFRPRYAVDLEILTPQGEKDSTYPVYTAVPLPVSGAVGMESGQFGFPLPGTLVVLGFAYGRPDHPVIRQIYSLGCSLPSVPFGEQRWQQDAAISQSVDAAGNWMRKTDVSITDDSLQHVRRTVDAVDEIARELRTIAENSMEEVGGVKQVEALGALKLLSGGVANISAGGSLNLTAARDVRQLAAQDRREATGRNYESVVKGKRDFTVSGAATDTIGGASTECAASKNETYSGAHTLKASSSTETVERKTIKGKTTLDGEVNTTGNVDAGGVVSCTALHIKGHGVNMLQVISNMMGETQTALNVLADHTHTASAKAGVGGSAPSVSIGVPKQQAAIRACANTIGVLKGQIDTML